MSWSGCAGPGPLLLGAAQPADVGERLAVPHLIQERDRCGSCALTQVYNFYGMNIQEQEVKDAVFRESIAGTLNVDMCIDAISRGYAAEWQRGSIPELVAWLDQGIPPILLLTRHGYNHYVVTVGYRKGSAQTTLLVHDGMNAYVPMSSRALLRLWKHKGFQMLIVQEE